MKLFHFFILLAGLVAVAPSVGWACSGSCVDDTDCSSNPCRYCDPVFSVCSDCCEFTEQVTCPEPPCTWTSGECRNINTDACGVAVSELPAASGTRHGWTMAGLAGIVFGATTLLGVMYRRRRTRRF